ncbi:hypothetical protein [Nannocystis pusilla]|uniref:hypothetical protein n=1 Tax=Nannocystis pusilla TaxID=889268 RepID=UPI003B7D0BD4
MSLLLTGCLNEERVWAGALVHAPFIYLVGLAVVRALHGPWARAVPGLRFGRRSHWTILAGLAVLAIWAAPRTVFDGLVLFWGIFGGTTLTLWLLLLRIGLVWPKSQPFLWSGALAFGLTLQFSLVGLLQPEWRDYTDFGLLVLLFGGGFGVTVVVVLAVLGFEAWRIGRRADAAIVAGEDASRRS